MTRSCSITIAGPAPYVWSCFTIELSLVPLFCSCFTIERNNAGPALRFEQDLAAIIVLNIEHVSGIIKSAFNALKKIVQLGAFGMENAHSFFEYGDAENRGEGGGHSLSGQMPLSVNLSRVEF